MLGIFGAPHKPPPPSEISAMPELPEVEVTRRGLVPHLAGRVISAVEVRQPQLRWPVSKAVHSLAGRTVRGVSRRGKYLLVDCGDGHLILHLGMSGSLRVLPPGTPAEKHDHFDLVLGDRVVRLRDPRRFGAVLWTSDAVETHPLLAGLGVEPLSQALNATRLYQLTRGYRTAIKLFLMDGRRIVGVGNIYAAESLFRAGIDPRKAAKRLTPEKATRLAKAIKDTLRTAIKAGGSTLRDFVGAGGNAGYMQNRFRVYDREGKPCPRCRTPVKRIVQGQRSTFFCPRCQK
jgi:formamidopyrimidine-DNA glycosylase